MVLTYQEFAKTLRAARLPEKATFKDIGLAWSEYKSQHGLPQTIRRCTAEFKTMCKNRSPSRLCRVNTKRRSCYLPQGARKSPARKSPARKSATSKKTVSITLGYLHTNKDRKSKSKSKSASKRRVKKPSPTKKIMQFTDSYHKSKEFYRLRDLNDLRIQNFIDFTNINFKKVQSVSPRVLKLLQSINHFGFFTVDSSEGICAGDLTNDEYIIRPTSSTYFVDETNETKKFYTHLKRAYVQGLIPKSLYLPLVESMGFMEGRQYEIFEYEDGEANIIILDMERIYDNEETKEYESGLVSRLDTSYDDYDEIVGKIVVESGYGDSVDGFKLTDFTKEEWIGITIVDMNWCIDGNSGLFKDLNNVLKDINM